jgi:predicted protein tyrosine phosphatase
MDFAQREKRFVFDWVLVDELAIGPAPRADRHLVRLESAGVKAVLSLCSEMEALPPHGIEDRFCFHRFVLPDHRSGRLPELAELQAALTALADLRKNGPVFVHCVAAMERSPLVCLGWLVVQHRQTPERALDYLMQVHVGTNPLPGQLALLGALVPFPQ